MARIISLAPQSMQQIWTVLKHYSPNHLVLSQAKRNATIRATSDGPCILATLTRNDHRRVMKVTPFGESLLHAPVETPYCSPVENPYCSCKLTPPPRHEGAATAYSCPCCSPCGESLLQL